MVEEVEMSEAMRNALQQAQAVEGIQLDDELSVRSRAEMRRIILPEAIARRLPEGTELETTMMPVYELGSRSSASGVRLTIPFGPKRAAITFD